MSIVPYRRIRKLGSGGMSDVFEVESPDGRRLALKVFRQEKEGRFLKERFIAEAKILQTLYHPHIVRVHEYGIDESSSCPWYAMYLVVSSDGTPSTLEDIRRQGKVPDATLRQWFAETKETLDYLHKCGVVHRDVKLDNILIDVEGHPAAEVAVRHGMTINNLRQLKHRLDRMISAVEAELAD